MKYTTPLNLEMQRELNKKLKRFAVQMMVLGGIIAIVSIALHLLEVSSGEEEPFAFILILCGSVCFVLGLWMLLACKKQEKEIVAHPKYCEYEFGEDFLLVDVCTETERLSNAKLYFKDIVKVEETEHYLCLFTSANNTYPILKSAFEEGEKSLLLQRINEARPTKKKRKNV